MPALCGLFFWPPTPADVFVSRKGWCSRGLLTCMTKNKDNRLGTSLHRLPHKAAAEQLKAQVLDVADEVFDRYVWGESFQAIADTLPFKVPGWKLRQILLESEETRETYANANILRSHNLIEAALDYGRQAASLGDAAGLRTAIDTNIKIAAKLNAAYNDKATVEHTGKNGGAIEVVADLSLTAEQAYERLIRGQ